MYQYEKFTKNTTLEIGSTIVLRTKEKVYKTTYTETSVTGKLIRGSYKVVENHMEVVKMRKTRKGIKITVKDLELDYLGGLYQNEYIEHHEKLKNELFILKLNINA